MEDNSTTPVESPVKQKRKKGSPLIIILAVILIIAAAVLALSMFAPDTFDVVMDKITSTFSKKDKAPKTEQLDDPVFTVYSYGIDPDEYRYYALYYKMYCEDQDPDFFKNHPEELPEIKTYIQEEIVSNYDIVYWAEYEGFKLDDITDEEYQAKYDEFRSQFETEQDFNDYMTLECLTPAVLEKVLRQQIIRAKLLDYVYSDECSLAQVTDEEMTQYYQDAKGFGIKQILVLHGSDDAEDADKKALIDGLMERINKGEDFDKLMLEYSEDPSVALYPDGYISFEGDLGGKFDETALALKVGEISQVIDTEYGYQIIQRIEPSLDMIYEQIGTGPIVDYHIAQAISDLNYVRTFEKGTNYDSLDISKLYNPFKVAIDEIKARDAE